MTTAACTSDLESMTYCPPSHSPTPATATAAASTGATGATEEEEEEEGVWVEVLEDRRVEVLEVRRAPAAVALTNRIIEVKQKKK